MRYIKNSLSILALSTLAMGAVPFAHGYVLDTTSAINGISVGMSAKPIVDWNQDGVVELLVANGAGTLTLFTDNGSGGLNEQEFAFASPDTNATPAVGDLDNDGVGDWCGLSA